jgi:DUF4097 and DUF4098 domain-containing protein YvlB
MITASPQRTLWLAAGGLLALVLTVWAGFTLVGWTVGSVERNTHHVLPGPVSRIEIDGMAGQVTLVPTGGRQVVVDSHAKGTLWLPKLETRIDGGHVTVRGWCHTISFRACSADFVVRVPEGTPVSVKTSSGDVHASGLSGPVDLQVSSGDLDLAGLSGGTSARVSSGDIDARGLVGRVLLESASGDVNAAELTSGVVNARATSGDVFLDLAAAPERVNAASSSGDVTIAVPRGPEVYDAQLTTSAGDPQLRVNHSAKAKRSLTAVTSAGDAMIRYR